MSINYCFGTVSEFIIIIILYEIYTFIYYTFIYFYILYYILHILCLTKYKLND